MVAVFQGEASHATDLIRRLIVLDRRIGDYRMPGRVAIEIPQDSPDALDRRIDHGRSDNRIIAVCASATHQRLQRIERRLNTPCPMSRAAGSRAPAHSRTRPTIRRKSGSRRSLGVELERGNVVIDAHRTLENRIGALIM